MDKNDFRTEITAKQQKFLSLIEDDQMIVERYLEAGKVADIASARWVLSVYNKRESEGYTREAWALEYPFNI